MLFGMDDRILQFFHTRGGDGTDLAAQVAERPDDAFHTGHTRLTQVFVRVERDIQRTAAEVTHQVRTGRALDDCRWAVDIHTRCRGIVGRQGFARAAPIRAGAQGTAQSRIVFKGTDANRQLDFILLKAPSYAGVFEVLQDARQDFVGVIVVVAVLGHLVEGQQAQFAIALPVVLDGVLEVFQGSDLVFIDQLFDRAQRVHYIGQAGDEQQMEGIRQDVGCRHIAALFDATVHQSRHQRVGRDHFGHAEVFQTAADLQVDLAVDLTAVSSIEAFEVLQVFECAGIHAFSLAGHDGHTAGEYPLQAAQIHNVRIAEVALARDEGLPAAVVGVITGIFERNTDVHEARDDGIIVVDSRFAFAVTQAQCQFTPQTGGRLARYAHRQGRHEQAHLKAQTQQLEGHFVGAVLAVTAQAADDHIHQPVVARLAKVKVCIAVDALVFLIAQRTDVITARLMAARFLGAGRVRQRYTLREQAEVVVVLPLLGVGADTLVALGQERAEQVVGALIGQTAGCHVLFIVREDVLVDTTERNIFAAAIDQRIGEPVSLQGFVHGFRRQIGYAAAHAADFKQFLAAHRIGFLCCIGQRLLGMTLSKPAHAFNRVQHRAVFGDRLGIRLICGILLFQLGLDLVDDAAEAHVQNLFPVRGMMPPHRVFIHLILCRIR